MEAFSDEVAREEYEKYFKQVPYHTYGTHRSTWLAAWRTLRELFANKTFVPHEPVVIHLPDGSPLPDPLPQFEGINYPIGGKPKE